MEGFCLLLLSSCGIVFVVFFRFCLHVCLPFLFTFRLTTILFCCLYGSLFLPSCDLFLLCSYCSVFLSFCLPVFLLFLRGCFRCLPFSPVFFSFLRFCLIFFFCRLMSLYFCCSIILSYDRTYQKNICWTSKLTFLHKTFLLALVKRISQTQSQQTSAYRRPSVVGLALSWHAFPCRGFSISKGNRKRRAEVIQGEGRRYADESR